MSFSLSICVLGEERTFVIWMGRRRRLEIGGVVFVRLWGNGTVNRVRRFGLVKEAAVWVMAGEAVVEAAAAIVDGRRRRGIIIGLCWGVS